MAYNAEDINGGQPEYYPAMPDFSLPFSMANIWKKKADELNNFNPMEHLALMQKLRPCKSTMVASSIVDHLHHLPHQ